jgi:benzoylformate decarboxylase
LQQVVAAYGSAPGFGWHPKTIDPEYLRIQRPTLDFVALAKTLGGQDGEIVQQPGDVGAAVRRGVDYVLRTGQSYILDVRTAQATPPPPPAEVTAAVLPARYATQPPLDIFHRQQGRALAAAAVHGAAAQIPVIF